MEISDNAKRIITEIGFDPNADYATDDLLHNKLHNAVSSLLQRKGFDCDYEITETGMACEEILDALADLP